MFHDAVMPPAPVGSVRPYRGDYEAHSHGHAQILLGLQGCLQLEVDGHGAFVDSASGLVVPAGTEHRYFAPSRAVLLVVDCPADRHTERVRRFAVPEHWRAAAADLDAAELVAKLADAPSIQARRKLDVAALAQRVDGELHRAWTLADLAASCGFSPQRFRARFAEIVGLPPLTWLRERRLDVAERRLRSGAPLEVVALEVGYSTASALCYALRRERSIGARALRRRA